MKYCGKCGGISGTFKAGFLGGLLRKGVERHRFRCLLIPRVAYSPEEGAWTTQFPAVVGPRLDMTVVYSSWRLALDCALEYYMEIQEIRSWRERHGDS